VKVNFDATLDDFVDVSNRAIARSKTIKSFRFSEKLSSIACALVCAVVLGLRWQGSSPHKLLVGVIAALLFLILFWALNYVIWQPLRTRRLRRLCQERLGTEYPVAVEIEVTESDIITRQLGSEYRQAWGSISDIEEQEDCIEIRGRGGLLVVRGRAFHSDEERREFLRLCEKWSGHSPERFIPQL